MGVARRLEENEVGNFFSVRSEVIPRLHPSSALPEKTRPEVVFQDVQWRR